MKAARFHWRYGRHSRIPVCCIVAFILNLTRRVPHTGESFAPCWGCYWLWRAGLRRFQTIHFCSPERAACREWTESHDHRFIDGVWYPVVDVTVTFETRALA